MIRQALSIAAIIILLATGTAAASQIERQRELFIKAEAALKAGHKARLESFRPQLTDYPLYGYLDYWELLRRLDKADAQEVREFLDNYRGEPIAERMRYRWLHQLGKRKDWDKFLRFYWPSTSTTLQCYEVRARLAQGDRERALQDALKLWLVGHSQPNVCDPAFDQLYASELITSQLIWKRIRLAFAEQKSSLAAFLAKRLSADDREWVKRWEFAHRRPTAALAKDWAQQDTPLVREILLHAIKRLARHKPEQAWKHWQQIAATHRFSEDDRGEAIRRIAYTAALQHDPKALDWLARVPDSHADENIRHWRIRAALVGKQWDQALDWVEQLPPDERQDENWRYWRAFALDAKGAAGDALSEYARLADSRSYFGFLSADRLQRKYAMNDTHAKPDRQLLAEIEAIPGIVRARELYLIGKRLEARREWYYATQPLSREQLKAAAEFAHRLGWHDRAIITASQAQHWSDLALRFPLPHRESIFANASRYDLDPALIYGVIRQESAFMEDAHSPVGALGLMQLMPATGRQTARSLNMRYGGQQMLLQSDQNIQLGSAYLRKLLNRYSGSPVLAAAAYNAGPHRVGRWLPDDESLPAALWVERIPFNETRNYVRRVLAYSTVFEWRLQRPITRLSSRMPVIQPHY
jgi:soluble lytic murein transglycosylase